MGWFDDLTKGMRLGGLALSGPVTVIDVDRLGSDVVNLTYEDGHGGVHRELLYRENAVELLAGTEDQRWSFDADPELFVLVAEAKRISLAYLFDPYLATHSSDVELLPHQIDAVYLDMLQQNPLRFLLADDPGAGKTIMAGLLVKELIVRGDLERCLIVVPGGLAEQWQDELGEKFGLEFELLTREMVESTRSGNPFETRHRLIARLDMLARDEGLQVHLGRTDWDLVIVDEAHKMSATYRGGDVEATKRYRLGQRLERSARHFLLMTATPHNGKPEDYQLFMALLDEDRFAGRFRRGVHSVEPPTDLMRRSVKEELLRFDGTKLFPEREATTAKYPLSGDERDLYERVTEYVTEGMNRARRLRQEGEGRRSAVVGFALTVLQRRLASSPRAIWRSLQRRRERLSARLAEAEMHKAAAAARSADPAVEVLGRVPSGYALADFEDLDPDEMLSSETENVETEILDEATAARTAEELRVEIAQLERLEMVNYDLPWNPNRIEQRFGRIHRIGQTEVCRLWNLVADDTREGKVFERLLDKLEEQRKALGGKVFDVLGQAFSDRSLRELLIEAITSDTPELQQLRMNEIIDTTVTHRVKELAGECLALTLRLLAARPREHQAVGGAVRQRIPCHALALETGLPRRDARHAIPTPPAAVPHQARRVDSLALEDRPEMNRERYSRVSHLLCPLRGLILKGIRPCPHRVLALPIDGVVSNHPIQDIRAEDGRVVLEDFARVTQHANRCIRSGGRNGTVPPTSRRGGLRPVPPPPPAAS